MARASAFITPSGARGVLHRDSDASTANAALALSTPTGGARRLRTVYIEYSSAATVDVTVTLNSGLGAAYDTLLQTISLSAATSGVWSPEGDIVVWNTDTIDVAAPAGGAGITSQVTIITEKM